MNNKTFYVINEDGMRVDARVLSVFKLTNNQDYLTYTYDEYNDEGMIKIYVTGLIDDSGNYSYKEISSDEEWNSIKTILKTLAKSEDEPFPEAIKSAIRVIGEEVSIRKSKKLLVSKKFADVIESKYTEDDSTTSSEYVRPIEEPIIETKVVEDPQLEKTIKIPTFEELQARNKSISQAMSNVNEEKRTYSSVSTYEEPRREVKNPTYESRVKKVDYEEKFKKDVEPVLLDVYAKQQKHIEELEEELSKTKFDLFEKQKEALSLSNEKDQIEKRTVALEQELDGVQKKMNGILNVLQGSNDR